MAPTKGIVNGHLNGNNKTHGLNKNGKNDNENENWKKACNNDNQKQIKEGKVLAEKKQGVKRVKVISILLQFYYNIPYLLLQAAHFL